MINILLCGANGKMGRAVTKAAAESPDVRIAAGYDINTTQAGGYSVYADFSEIKEEIDAVIDFSNPAVFDGLMEYAEEKGIPVIICTTGLSAEQNQKLKSASEKIPVFFSANMSIGVNLMIDLVSRAAKILESNFDIEIIEKHHNQKIDAPSGTALAIADAISESVSYNPEYTYDRHSVRRKRDKNEIGIHAVRGGTIVGEHSVIFAGTDEVLEIKHQANSKEIFAVGAVKAAKFIVGKPNGMYNMSDVIDAAE